MKKIIYYSQILSIVFILLASGSIHAQKKGKIHIEVVGNKEKIDTVIEFNGDIAPEEIQSIISAITGEDIDVKMYKKGNNKMVWVSDDDFDTDSLMKEINNKMKMYEFDDAEFNDSILKSLNIKIDSLNNFILNVKDMDFSWIADDSIDGEHVFVFKNDTCITNVDSLMKSHSQNKKIIIKTLSGDEDEILMEFKDEEGGKKGKYIVKTISSDEDGNIKKIIIITDKDGKKKHKSIQTEDDTKKDTMKQKRKKRKGKTIKVEVEIEDEQ